MCQMYMTDFAYDGPIFLVPLSLSYPSSPVPNVSRKAPCSLILKKEAELKLNHVLHGLEVYTKQSLTLTLR